MELIPAIDLRDGRCVRLLKGDFAAETVYSDDPQSVLDGYQALGARRVHIVDLDGARDGTQPNRPIVLLLAILLAGLVSVFSVVAVWDVWGGVNFGVTSKKY